MGVTPKGSELLLRESILIREKAHGGKITYSSFGGYFWGNFLHIKKVQQIPRAREENKRRPEMMKEKATLRLAKGSADHNDRTKMSSSKNVIDQTKTSTNLVYVTDRDGNPYRIGQGAGKLREAELKLYEECYGASLERKNEHYRKKGNKKQIKTIEEAYSSKPPKEMILQIGKGHKHDKQDLFYAVNEFFGDLIERNPNIRIFSIAIHCDETSTHCHVRFTIEHETEYGDIEVNQSKGLKDMGYTPKEQFDKQKFIQDHPNINFTSKEGKRILKDAKENHERYDNAMIEFTDFAREMWYDTLERLDYSIDREVDPKNRSRRNKKTQEYKHDELVKENKKLTRENIQAKFLNDDLRQDNERIKNMKEFLHEKGLEGQFEAFMASKHEQEQSWEYDL